MNVFLDALYLFLPAGIANATPPLLTRFFGAGRPIDGGRTWRGLPLFGAHKTWQGFVGGTIAGTIAFLIQRAIDDVPLPLIAGVAMSAGALAGDLLKSFAKRRFDVAPGKTWFPLDQLDYVFGALLASLPFMPMTLSLAGAVVVVYFVLHLIVSAAGYAIGVKDSPL